jgi:hypothetical protein
VTYHELWSQLSQLDSLQSFSLLLEEHLSLFQLLQLMLRDQVERFQVFLRQHLVQISEFTFPHFLEECAKEESKKILG